MPEMRYYTATQEREVKLWANSPAEAAQLAAAPFGGEIKEGDVAAEHITSPVRERDLAVREDY
jgi:hypothetical protein